MRAAESAMSVNRITNVSSSFGPGVSGLGLTCLPRNRSTSSAACCSKAGMSNLSNTSRACSARSAARARSSSRSTSTRARSSDARPSSGCMPRARATSTASRRRASASSRRPRRRASAPRTRGWSTTGLGASGGLAIGAVAERRAGPPARRLAQRSTGCVPLARRVARPVAARADTRVAADSY